MGSAPHGRLRATLLAAGISTRDPIETVRDYSGQINATMGGAGEFLGMKTVDDFILNSEKQAAKAIDVSVRFDPYRGPAQVLSIMQEATRRYDVQRAAISRSGSGFAGAPNIHVPSIFSHTAQVLRESHQINPVRTAQVALSVGQTAFGLANSFGALSRDDFLTGRAILGSLQGGIGTYQATNVLFTFLGRFGASSVPIGPGAAALAGVAAGSGISLPAALPASPGATSFFAPGAPLAPGAGLAGAPTALAPGAASVAAGISFGTALSIGLGVFAAASGIVSFFKGKQAQKEAQEDFDRRREQQAQQLAEFRAKVEAEQERRRVVAQAAADARALVRGAGSLRPLTRLTPARRQGLADTRTDFLRRFVRAPQFASSVGLIRELEQDLQRSGALTPRF